MEALFIVTGAAGGIGRPFCLQLAEAGSDLVLVGRKSGPLGDLATLCLSLGARSCAIIKGDIRQLTTQQRATQAARDYTGRDIFLVNNAGMNIEGPFLERENEDMDQIISANLVAPMQLTRRIAKATEGRKLCVVNIGSVLGAIGIPDYVAYSASKAGLRGFTQALNRELGGKSRRAIYFGPRAVETAFNSPESLEKQRQNGQSVDTPATIARWIFQRLNGRRSEYFYGWPERAFVKLNALLPSLVDRSLAVPPSPLQSNKNEHTAQEAIR